MKQIPLAVLRENTYFDSPVYLDEKYILLSPDVKTTSELLQRLERWGYTGVYCDGNPVEAPSYTQTGKMGTAKSILDLDLKEKQRMEAARKLYYSLLNFTVEGFKRFNQTNRLDLEAVTERVKELIEMVKASRDAILRYPEFVYVSHNYIYQHSVNSAILALAVGDMLKLPPHRQIEVGIGALLHDIGMQKIPENIYLTGRPLDPKEWQMVKAHAMLGYRILKGFSVSDAIALTAWEHHERLDGSGYPRSLKGDEITLYSRIIGAVCSYDAITAKRQFRSPQEGHSAQLELLKGRKTLYDENVIRALIYCLSLFPLGTLVLLSDGAIGRVVRTNPESPKTPFVQILIDKDGNRLTEMFIAKSSEQGELAVKRNLSWKEVEAHNLV